MRVNRKSVSTAFVAVLLAIPLLARSSTTAWAEGSPRFDMTNSEDWVTATIGGAPVSMRQMDSRELKDSAGVNGLDSEHQYLAWVQTDTKATSGIRWGTGSLVITEDRIDPRAGVDSGNTICEIAVGSPGESVTGSNGGKIEKSNFDMGGSSSIGSVQTGFYVDANEIAEKYLESLANDRYGSEKYDKIMASGKLTFYVQPVTYSYQIRSDGSTIPRKSGLRDLSSWASAEGWSDGGASFASHYNIEIKMEIPKVLIMEHWRVRKSDDTFTASGVKVKPDAERSATSFDGIYESFQPDNNNGEYTEVPYKQETSAGNVNKRGVCIGFYYYYNKDNGEQKNVTRFNLGDGDLKSVKKNAVYPIMQDVRYDSHGNRKNTIKGTDKTAAEINEKLNSEKFANFDTDKDDSDAFHLVWLYLPVESTSVNVSLKYCDEGSVVKDLAEGAVVPHSDSSVKSMYDYSETVAKGDTWIAYRDEGKGYTGRDLSGYDAEAAADARKSWEKYNQHAKFDKERIPLTIRYNDSYDCYLWKIKISGGSKGGEDLELFQGWRGKSEWSTNQMYLRSERLAKTGKWYTEAKNIQNLKLKNIQSDVKITCYYSITVPVKIVVYNGTDGGSYSVGEQKEVRYWASGAVIDNPFTKNDDNAIAVAGAGIQKYATIDSWNKTFRSVAEAKNKIKVTAKGASIGINGQAKLKVPSMPYVVANFIDKSSGSERVCGYRTIRYVHENGKYYQVENEWHELPYYEEEKFTVEKDMTTTPAKPQLGQFHDTEEYKDGVLTVHKANYYYEQALKWYNEVLATREDSYSFVPKMDSDGEDWKQRKLIDRMSGKDGPVYQREAYVSFPWWEEFNQGGGKSGIDGYGGGVYKLGSVYESYSGYSHPYKGIMKSILSPEDDTVKGSSNGTWHKVWNIRNGDDENDPEAKKNQLVVIGVYECVSKPGDDPDFEDNWEYSNEWNWGLPEGYAEGDATAAPWNASKENDYPLHVSGTHESSVFDAQLGIPSSDYVRVRSQVPRYLTNGVWVQHNLKMTYHFNVYEGMENKVVDTKKKLTDYYKRKGWKSKPGEASFSLQEYSADAEWEEYTKDSDVDMYRMEMEFVDYGPDPENGAQPGSTVVRNADVVREATWYELDEFNVWDPKVVSAWNDTFSNEANCVKKNVCTLPGQDSGAYYTFEKAANSFEGQYSTVNQQEPEVKVDNYWVNLDACTGEEASDLDVIFDKIVTQWGVCNDQIVFYDGDGYAQVITSAEDGYTQTVTTPNRPVDAKFTDPEMFDSAKYDSGGIQIIPTIYNGHHDTISQVTYKQTQFHTETPTVQESTPCHERPVGDINTQIVDDGDDDVEVYTPAVNYSKVYLTPGGTEKGEDGQLLHPEHDWNQRCYSADEYHPDTVVLDMEYRVKVSDNGYASSLPGYGAQNYARYLEKNSAGNPYMQVKFPFPVEMGITGADGSKETRYYLEGTWISLEVPLSTGEKVYTFLVPSWAHEYEAALTEFRSITINARANNKELDKQADKTNDSQAAIQRVVTPHNYDPVKEKNYVAHSQQEMQIVGRLYGFRIVDISDYPTWQSVFRKYDEERKEYSAAMNGNSYKPGTKNQNGFDTTKPQWVIPTIDGSHPVIANAGALGTGFKVRYRMESVGEYFSAQDAIEVTPECYYMNADGEYLQEDGTWSKGTGHRKWVDVYYNETIEGKKATLVKVGSEQDTVNQKRLNVTGEDFGILEKTIRKTAESLGISTEALNKATNQYSFGAIKMTPDMRVFVGDEHSTILKNGESYDFNPKMYHFAGLTPEEQSQYLNGHVDDGLLEQLVSQDAILQSVQQWYGEYYLPSETFATVEDWETVKEKVGDDFTGTEDCWLQGGFLVVNFQPVLTTGGEDRLAYDNTHFVRVNGEKKATECNMWEIEGYQKERTEYSGRKLNFSEGDVILYTLGGGSPADPGDSGDPNDPADPGDPSKKKGGGSSSTGSAKDRYGSHGTH